MERLNREDFKAQIQSPALSLIEFYSDSCVPCKRLSPILAEFEEAHPEILTGKVNVIYETELAQELNVLSSPTVLLYQNGKELARLNGRIKKADLEALIQSNE